VKRELKRQIKQDEFISGLENAAAWVKAHAQTVRIGGGAALVVAVLVGGVWYFQRSRALAAETAFAAALDVYETPVAGAAAPGAEKAAGPTFASEQEKAKKAAAAFDGVERAYPSLDVGLRARYYGALARIEMGDLATAEKTLAEVAASNVERGLEPALARLALAEVKIRKGDLQEGARAFLTIAEDTSFPLPRGYAFLRLAETLERSGRSAEARDAYLRLVNEHPDSAYAPEARRRADYLSTPARG
jgi:TolA-binding protein